MATGSNPPAARLLRAHSPRIWREGVVVTANQSTDPAEVCRPFFSLSGVSPVADALLLALQPGAQ